MARPIEDAGFYVGLGLGAYFRVTNLFEISYDIVPGVVARTGFGVALTDRFAIQLEAELHLISQEVFVPMLAGVMQVTPVFYF